MRTKLVKPAISCNCGECGSMTHDTLPPLGRQSPLRESSKRTFPPTVYNASCVMPGVGGRKPSDPPPEPPPESATTPLGDLEVSVIRWSSLGRGWRKVSRDLHHEVTGRYGLRFTDAANEVARRWLAGLPLSPQDTKRVQRWSSIGGNWTWVTVPHQFVQEAQELLASLAIEERRR